MEKLGNGRDEEPTGPIEEDAVRYGPTSAESRLTAAELARQVLANGRIKLDTQHHSGVLDNATPDKQVAATALGRRAELSAFGGAPGGVVDLDPRILSAMLKLAESFSFEVSEIAGGVHPRNGRHYAGLAFDVSRINGAAVNASHPHWRAFLRRGRALGATEAFGPGMPGASHIHLGWSPAASLRGAFEERSRVPEGTAAPHSENSNHRRDSLEQCLRQAIVELELRASKPGTPEMGCQPPGTDRPESVILVLHHLREALRALGHTE